MRTGRCEAQLALQEPGATGGVHQPAGAQALAAVRRVKTHLMRLAVAADGELADRGALA